MTIPINYNRKSILHVHADYVNSRSDMETFAVFLDAVKKTLLGAENAEFYVDYDKKNLTVAFDGQRPDDPWVLEMFSICDRWFREAGETALCWLDIPAGEYLRYVRVEDNLVLEYSLPNGKMPSDKVKPVFIKNLRAAFREFNTAREVGTLPDNGSVEIGEGLSLESI